MHKNSDINLKNISKIEGHTHLDVKVREGKVIECKLKISENKRFITNAIIGMKYNLVPNAVSRICGTCSSAHSFGSIEAIEKALDISPSRQTMLLRNLQINASHLRDHAMHLYFFCLPDIFGKDSILDFNEKGMEHQFIHDGLDVKEAGNHLITIIGGRVVHPPNAVVGGFTNIPSKQNVKIAIEKLEDSREKILRLIDLFYKKDLVFKRETNCVALVNLDYNLLKGEIKTSKGTKIPEERYADHLTKVVIPYSTATAFEWESKEYMVGALARINLNKESLNKRTKKDTAKYLSAFPSNNIFQNNLAQAIEMLHEVDASLNILKNNTFKNEKPLVPKLKSKTSTGIGVVEAPRGTLYYHLDIDKDGKITYANLCIPTQQNIIHMEKDIAAYVEKMIDKPKQEISLNVERLIRAYDPCMSCATHFLKINWK